MIVIPAIDLLGGRCVRLQQGDYQRETVYDSDPLAVARRWAETGAGRLHLVDLDGAKEGRPVHMATVTAIARQLTIPVEIGGGIRDLATITAYLEAGVRWVILGSVAVEKPELVAEACQKFPGQIVVGIDARAGRVATRGWLEESSVDAVELGKRMGALGVQEIIYTDIARDGMLSGPNIPALEEMARQTGLSVIASGGVSSLQDLIELKKLEGIGVRGAIVGKALYDGRLDLAEALRQVEGGTPVVG
ncbi:MAG TPA: 1-(5-phosphoribosyl)-5-[(5-phosphoribosylamino)methylideneamino]imidazole-4-carboxamide isomerase [Firmicutes bacterium]|jgi:phosphoribosylformimino-5-aminoimidazole carboxamide ribotide isomerase|nr:1-(5-phosphoribosyl)-5-[(5-phosphoribosylamino)methylideneamino]imidazole-4-carboxamide isomerase [Bacillota bacterium]HOQ24942.1 1-(5-phosphoribosyl)-5-[(5-phosphoribosylamino)methylideneamino]imidazole-4-carboxamide isomerase [Bacillota bacterium]HPT68133.1 1-(5-phosphoribosyl)-5-[(5-phosphoribosylamino)methylideneamino]imidazole-4-carboxamide isomerase [Bacillota bacterium]